jgi:DNA-binding CsgD family transcriptional regulator
MRVAATVVLDSSQQRTLEQWARARSLRVRQVERAEIVLLAAKGMSDLEISAALQISSQ